MNTYVYLCSILHQHSLFLYKHFSLMSSLTSFSGSWRHYFSISYKLVISLKFYLSLLSFPWSLPCLYWEDSFDWYIIFGWHFNFHAKVWICHSTALWPPLILMSSKILYHMWFPCVWCYVSLASFRISSLPFSSYLWCS